LKIACLEEVAFRAGFVDRDRLEQVIASLPKGEYRDYLQLVSREDSLVVRSEPMP
jgi:hypothetical protein